MDAILRELTNIDLCFSVSSDEIDENVLAQVEDVEALIEDAKSTSLFKSFIKAITS